MCLKISTLKFCCKSWFLNNYNVEKWVCKYSGVVNVNTQVESLDGFERNVCHSFTLKLSWVWNICCMSENIVGVMVPASNRLVAFLHGFEYQLYHNKFMQNIFHSKFMQTNFHSNLCKIFTITIYAKSLPYKQLMQRKFHNIYVEAFP